MTSKIFPYLNGYPQEFHAKVAELLASGELLVGLERKYSGAERVTNDAQLRELTLQLKTAFLRRSPPLSVIRFDDKIGALHGALGLHTYASRVQGTKMKAKNELRVASLFKKLPVEFVRVVVVHELAHLKEKEHNKGFYRICQHMEPDYDQIELDLRLHLTAKEYAETR